jgi:hypothetical protein
MDSAELRAVQEPLKDTYRKDPREALITLRAHGQLDEQAIACSVDTGRQLAVAGLHPATGGDHQPIRAPYRRTASSTTCSTWQT